MCSGGGSPKAPKPTPPPEYASYAQSRKRLSKPKPGEGNPTILTSPLGVSSDAFTQQATLLGQ